MPPDEAKPGPKPETARPFAPEAKGVPGLPRPVAPLPVAPPIAVVRVEGPGRGVQRPIESDRSPAPPEPPIRRAVPIELPRVAADPVPPVKPRRVAPPLLPRDPDRLAASAARLGLLPPNPALPSVPAALPDATVKPVSPVAPQMRPETKPPVTGLAKPEADSEPVRRPVVVPSPAAARMAAAKPVPKALPAAPAATDALRPAERQGEPLPSTPPRAEPRVRVEIGRVTLVAPEAKGPGGALAGRKSVLAPVARRAGRGHSIPRPGGQ